MKRGLKRFTPAEACHNRTTSSGGANHHWLQKRRVAYRGGSRLRGRLRGLFTLPLMEFI